MATGLRRALLVTCLLTSSSAVLTAAEWVVGPQGPPLAEVLASAAAGDTVRVRGGRHRGPFEVALPLRLVGEGWPVLDGGGEGTVLRVTAPGVEIEGFEVRGSGDSLDREDAGIVLDEAPRGVVRGNRLDDVLFGVYLRQSPGTAVADNRIRGKDLDLARRGDAIRVWYSDDVEVAGNDIAAARDLVLWYSARLELRGNRVRDGRYGLHFMYCDDATIGDNLLLDNSVGAFLMYSRRLRLVGNTLAGNHGPSGYGVGLKDMDDAVVRGNLLVGNRVGVFLDNSPREAGSVSEVRGNVVAANDIGVLLMPNVRRAGFTANGFVENRQQMALAGAGGDPEANVWTGNYWSDYAGFDADGDGRGDLPYRAERLFELLGDRHPELRLFVHSPAARALDLAAAAFPVVRPRPKLTDPEPRVAPVELAGVPPLPGADGSRRNPAAIAALLLGLALVALPWRRRRRRAIAAEGAEGAADTTGGKAIAVRGLSKRYGATPALADVDFTIGRGESAALWGPNGAGKTTALRAMLGILGYQGEIRVMGLDPLADGREVRRRIGFVPQEIGLPGDLGVRESLELFAGLRGVSPAGSDELLGWLGLEDRAGDRVEELSGGLKQRLALGVALLGDPPILLLDEPTANLDAAGRRALYRRLGELRARGKTLVFTSHRSEEVAMLADRVLRLDRGRLVGDEGASAADLAGDGEVELDLRLPPDRLPAAMEALAEAGFPAERVGSCLIVRVPAAEKAAPLNLLVERGFRLEDFACSRSWASENGGDRPA